MRSILPVLALVLMVLMAGCSSQASVTIEQSGLAAASGKESKTVDCQDGEGSLHYTTKGTSGKIKLRVNGPDEVKIVDDREVAGTTEARIDDFTGPKGTWTLTVERSDFSGDYSVTLSC